MQFGTGGLRSLRSEMQEARAIEPARIVLCRRNDLVRLAFRDRQARGMTRRLLGRRFVMESTELDRPIGAPARFTRQRCGFRLAERRWIVERTLGNSPGA